MARRSKEQVYEQVSWKLISTRNGLTDFLKITLGQEIESTMSNISG